LEVGGGEGKKKKNIREIYIIIHVYTIHTIHLYTYIIYILSIICTAHTVGTRRRDDEVLEIAHSSLSGGQFVSNLNGFSG